VLQPASFIQIAVQFDIQIPIGITKGSPCQKSSNLYD